MSDLIHKFQQLNYTHDELEEMLDKLKRGYVLYPSDYEELLKKGIANISTFSGDYNDLRNKPDINKEIADSLNKNEIETSSTIQARLQRLMATFNEHYQRIDNGLRKDMIILEMELYEYLNEKMFEQSEELKHLMDEWCIALSIDLENLLNERLVEYDNKIQKILSIIEEPPTYIKPSLSLSVSNKVEHNMLTNLNITPNYVSNDAGEIVSYTLKRGSTILLESTKLESYKDQVLLEHGDTTTYTATVEYKDGPIKNSNLDIPYPSTSIKAGSVTTRANVNCYAYSYYGVIDTDEVTEADIINMNKFMSTFKNYTEIYTLDRQRSVYMYPSSFGTLSSIKDANNFDYIDSYKLTHLTIDGVEYNVYILKDPVKINNFKQIFA